MFRAQLCAENVAYHASQAFRLVNPAARPESPLLHYASRRSGGVHQHVGAWVVCTLLDGLDDWNEGRRASRPAVEGCRPKQGGVAG